MAPLPLGSTIGILGSGQLGRMLAMASAQLGFKCHIYADASGPAFDVAAAHTVAPYDDLETVKAFAASVDVVTYEFENVPLETAAAALSVRPVAPGPKALEVSQDRLTEKLFLSELGIPLAPFAEVNSIDDLKIAAEKIGRPAILKTRRLGYDGKGQVRINPTSDLMQAHAEISSAPAILEGLVKFQREVSVLAVRDQAGQIAFYDIPENSHKDGILDTSTVPSTISLQTQQHAHTIARKIADALSFVGVLTVELFLTGDNTPVPLVVNEIAPRVHNSGHWTIDACAVSQFENHIRSITGWPLGDTARHSDATMTNLIGPEINAAPTNAAEPGVCVHIYGKRDARPGRKMGHMTKLAPKSAS